MLLTSTGLVGVYCILTKNKTSTMNEYKKLREEKINNEIKMLKILKNEISPKISDDLIKNIMESENKLLDKIFKE